MHAASSAAKISANPASNIFEGDRMGQCEIQVLRKPIVLK